MKPGGRGTWLTWFAAFGIAALGLAVARPVRAGAPSAPCDEPFVFSSGTVNLVVLPYDYHSSEPGRRGSELADQIPLLVQANGLLQMLRYGGVGSLNLVDPHRSLACRPERVLAALTKGPFREGKLKAGHGLILLWGTLYEEGGTLEVQTFMRVMRGGRDESFLVRLPGGQSMRVKPSTTTLSFAPRSLTDADLSAIRTAFDKAVEVRTHPSPEAPLAGFSFYDPQGHGSSYSVIREQKGWLEVRGSRGQLGWVRADLGGGGVPLSGLLPEVEFIGLAAGYLRARIAAEGPVSPAPARTLEWVRNAMQRYLAGSGPDVDEVSSAVARQMVALAACSLPGAGESEWTLADTLAARAATLLPHDAEAQRLAGAMILRADVGRGDVGARSKLAEGRLARAAVASGGREAALQDLKALYTVACGPGAPSGGANRLSAGLAAERLLALAPKSPPVPEPGPLRNLEGGPSKRLLARLVDSESIRIDGIHFETGSAVLMPGSTTWLDSLSMELAEHADARLEIQAFTDSRGSAATNQSLSEARAEAVRRYLLDHAPLRPEQLVPRGFGENRPLVSESTEAGRVMNRRVMLRLLNPEVLKDLERNKTSQ